MKSPATARVLFLAGMVFASAAFAGTGINKCVTPSGHVTLTDEVCPGDSETVKVINGTDADDTASTAAPATNRSSAGVERYMLPRLPTRFAKQSRYTPSSGGLSLDVATLKAARVNMQMFNTAPPRAQRIAALQ
ncbi:MAG: DUF4124 domain-containing protein [Pseudomonadota bacterium]